MKKTRLSSFLALVLCLVMVMAFVACNKEEKKQEAKEPAKQEQKADDKKADDKKAEEDKKVEEEKKSEEENKDEEVNEPAPVAPGDTGFNEIDIDTLKIVGPFQVQLVYFQAVDMIPEGKQPSAAESDMHLEADIHLTEEAATKYGFGAGEEVWPGYLTVDYKIMSEDGKTEVASGSFMPMNASDGPHYGINIKKDVVPVGKYKIVLEIKASDDYLLHVDSETGVPLAVSDSKEAAATYYEKQIVEVEWNYTGEQLENK